MEQNNEINIDISTQIGNFVLNSCIYNASGCWCTEKKELDDLLESKSGAIISKSSTLNYRNGNIKPRKFLNDIGSINSMGIPNNGYKFYLNYKLNLIKNNIDKVFIQSITPFNKNELIEMLTYINKEIGKYNISYLIELNLSCPNLIKKDTQLEFKNKFDIFEYYLSAINKCTFDNIVLGLKLPPFFLDEEFDSMSNIIKFYNIKFITCINSLQNGLLIDYEKETTIISPKNGLGGIGGKYCKPITLSNVYQFNKRLNNVNIIGCGGVDSGKDVFELILAGACAVQVGTFLLKESPTIFNRLNEELKQIMINKRYSKINDFRGKLKN